MSEECVFVVNPSSAAGATLRRFERMRPALHTALGAFDVRITERPGHATEIVREAIATGARTIVSVGGDGTNNEVVNGFFDDTGAPLAGQPRLALVPSGTGGDFRRTLGLKEHVRDVLAQLSQPVPRPCDVGRLRFTRPDGETAVRMFLNIASFGLPGQVDAVVNQSSKALGAKASFISGTLRAFVTYRAPKVEIIVDDGPPVVEQIALVAVANGRYFGGGMQIAPDARIDDGVFDIVQVLETSKWFWLKNAARVYAGTHVGLDEVAVRRGKTLSARPVDPADEVLIDVDGEQPGRLPARFEILPGAIALLAP